MINLDISPEEYQSSLPYPHCAIEDVIEADFALKCQEEILNIPDSEWDRYNNPFEQKYTLRDKNNFPKHCQQLFNLLTSEETLQKLSTIVGEPLFNDPTKNWWGIHKYVDGDYLDIHSDAGIHPGTEDKKHLTLGIYLSKDWKEENKGHLEIWNGDSVTKNDAKLSTLHVKILPTFNKLVLFNNTNNAWHGNPASVNIKNNEKRIFVTLSYLSKKHDNGYENRRKKAFFVKLPDEPENPEKDKLRLLRADSEKYQEIYSIFG